MPNLSQDQANKLDSLGEHFPGIGRTDGITPAKLGAALYALGPITSAVAVAAAGDPPTQAEFNVVVTLLNEIRTKINAAILAAGG
jgi:hypothetical protein